MHYIGQHWQFSVHLELNSVLRQHTQCTLHSTKLTVQCTYGPEQAVCSDSVHHVHYIVHRWQFSVHMDLNSVFRQCTPCTIYSTTLTVQSTYGPKRCVQTVYTMYIIKYNIDSSECIWSWTVCSDSVHHVHYIVHHWQFRVHMDLNSVLRQCTPCTLYSTTLTVQCTYGAEQCVQTVYTMYII